MGQATIAAYVGALDGEEKAIGLRLRALIDSALPDADSKIWHAHPVWFLNGNSVVGFSKLKNCIRLLFWSGQSFETPGLAPEGSFKAAEKRFTSIAQIDEVMLARWLADARTIQWDYKNIVKRRGKLERLA